MGEEFITGYAYAKINLGLAIVGQRADGYHDLQSIMQSIELHDIVRVRRQGQGIKCACGELSGEANLAYRAAQLFLSELGQETGIEIEIEKYIPTQAGLAGGSADAAATLRLLNRLFGEPFSKAELEDLASRCGADVPFCLTGGTQWVSGIGEQLAELPAAPLLHLVVVKPVRGVDTRQAYHEFDRRGTYGALDRDKWISALESGQVEEVAKLLSNDLEQASAGLVPEVLEIKQELVGAGCHAALMSGSGSAVFGIARDEQHCTETAEYFRKAGYAGVWNTKVVHGWKGESD